MELNEQELIRRQKIEELTGQGINPYPAELWEVNCTSKQILTESESNPDKFKDCLLYTSDAADERSSVDLGGRRIIKNTKNKQG